MLLAPDPLLGRVIDGKYRIEALIGSGGQGTVYRAVHLLLERTTALKIIRSESLADPAAADRFRREARTLAQLRHPNVVTIHDFGVDPTLGFFLVMEHLRGHSLSEELRQQGRLPEGLVLEIMRQVCEGVGAAHEEGVIHCDLKPDNIFLETGSGGALAVKIVDFGVAKLRRRSSLPGSSPDDSFDDAIIGTPQYMAPELFAGRQQDASTDIYALGCVLYEAVTGRLPFLGRDVPSVARQHAVDTAPPPSSYGVGLRAELDAIVARALAKIPTERFGSAAELASALAVIEAAPAGGEARPGTPPARHPVRLPADGADAWPTITTGVSAPNNLPLELTSFVGRESEVGDVTTLVRSRRLVTLTGPGGSGKTRLSLKVASDLLTEFRDGVWLVELASIASPELIELEVATALGLPENAGATTFDAIVGALRAKRVLLVLDNCEHVVQACATLASTLLRACQGLHLLATSQEALNVPGESTWVVRPLSLPPSEAGSAPDTVLRSEAARLFADRAALSRPGFRVTEQNARAVAEICHQLDGIPLAIELAASRIRLLSVAEIARRLSDRFKLLNSGARGAQPRQSTLRGAIDWSYDLLSDAERALFGRLSVFSGGFAMEGAEAVCADADVKSEGESVLGGLDSGSGAVRVEAVLETLTRLVDKSLVIVDEAGEASRFRLLETIRAYGAERLQQSGAAVEVRRRHRDHFLELAERAEPELEGPEQVALLDRLETEHDNFRAALDWSTTDAATSDALLRLASALARFWYVRHHVTEGLGWLTRAVGVGRRGPALAQALSAGGELARLQGDFDRASRWLESAVELWRSEDDAPALARALNRLGVLEQWRGDRERSASLLSEALEIARAHGVVREAAYALNNLGISALHRGDDDTAEARFEESLRLFREVGDLREVASALNNLGVLAGSRGAFAAAAALGEEHLEIRRQLGDRRGVAIALNNLGETLLRKGELERAGAVLVESMSLYETMGDRRGIAFLLETFATLAVEGGLWERALRFAGAAAELRVAIGAPLPPADAGELEAALARARAALGGTAAERAFRAGAEMPLESVLQYATAALSKR